MACRKLVGVAAGFFGKVVSSVERRVCVYEVDGCVWHLFKCVYVVILFYAGTDHALNPQYMSVNYRDVKARFPYTDSKGRRYRYSTDTLTSVPGANREYADEDKGEAIGTCWTDIKIAGPKERTGYPTQKPLSLLERIIKASSNEGDIVCDPYCGSGTTVVAADRLNRNWIGIDENEEAIHITKRRLA